MFCTEIQATLQASRVRCRCKAAAWRELRRAVPRARKRRFAVVLYGTCKDVSSKASCLLLWRHAFRGRRHGAAQAERCALMLRRLRPDCTIAKRSCTMSADFAPRTGDCSLPPVPSRCDFLLMGGCDLQYACVGDVLCSMLLTVLVTLTMAG